MCDLSVRLESFAGSDMETNPMYRDYHGEGVKGMVGHLGMGLKGQWDTGYGVKGWWDTIYGVKEMASQQVWG